MSFTTKTLPVQQFLSLNGVLKDYLQEEKRLQPFISSYCSLENLEAIIKAKAKSYSLRNELVDVLHHQSLGTPLHQQQSKSLERLRKETTFCMTTAHQTNVFGGPLYFIQKAISTIKACRLAQETYPTYQFVPIYWLGSEDHDFEELNHTFVNGKKIEWQTSQRGAFGRFTTDGLDALIKQIEDAIGVAPNAQSVIRLLQRAYSPERTIAQATRYLLSELLGKYGLLVIDGDDETLKRLMIPIFERELQSQFSSKAAQTAIQFLEQQYGKSQAHSRDINLFYLTDTERKRIVKQGKHFFVHQSEVSFSEDELLLELQTHPERFSPNVMLRPVMQEFVLPNILYVGGGGELSYWLQLKPIFDEIHLPFPMLGLRDTAVYLSNKINKKIEQIGASISDLAIPQVELEKQLVKTHTNHQLQLDAEQKLFEQGMQQLHQKATTIDASLGDSAKAEQKRILNAIQNLEKKMLRAEKKNQSILLQRIDAIYNHIYPKGTLQERHDNFSQYYSEYGDAWVNWMVDNFNLFHQTVKICIDDN